jgi:hypothetical protein
MKAKTSLIMQVTQFLTVCRAYNLAEALHISSPLRSPSPAKRRASSIPSRAHGHHHGPTTNHDQVTYDHPLPRPLAHSHEGPVPSAAALAARPHSPRAPTYAEADQARQTSRKDRTKQVQYLTMGMAQSVIIPTVLCHLTDQSNDRQPHRVL